MSDVKTVAVCVPLIVGVAVVSPAMTTESWSVIPCPAAVITVGFATEAAVIAVAVCRVILEFVVPSVT